jgi:hypothetical protein
VLVRPKAAEREDILLGSASSTWITWMDAVLDITRLPHISGAVLFNFFRHKQKQKSFLVLYFSVLVLFLLSNVNFTEQ